MTCYAPTRCKRKDMSQEVFSSNIKCLNISGQNVYGHLDLTGNPSLEVVVCVHNKIRSITCNDNLQKLICSDNEITTIKCNDSLQWLECQNNQITNIICKKIHHLLCSENPDLCSTKDSRVSLSLYKLNEIVSPTFTDALKYLNEWYNTHPSDLFYDKLSLGAQIHFVLAQRRWIRRLWKPNSTIVNRIMESRHL